MLGENAQNSESAQIPRILVTQLYSVEQHLSKKNIQHNLPALKVPRNQEFIFWIEGSFISKESSHISFEIIFGRIQVGVFFLVGNAILKTGFLVFLFLNAFRRMLTEPLSELTQQINEFDIDRLERSKLDVKIDDENELAVLRDAYNKLVDDLIDFQNRLGGAQSELKEANRKLDEQNLLLESEPEYDWPWESESEPES